MFMMGGRDESSPLFKIRKVSAHVTQDTKG